MHPIAPLLRLITTLRAGIMKKLIKSKFCGLIFTDKTS